METMLERVGLAELIDRETSTLSGGELQRLAIAAALARTPRLLISDESTAMVDATGRALLVDLFRDLAHGDGLGVVHVTHRAVEASAADRSITLAGGRVVDAAARLRTDEMIKGAQPHPAPSLGAPVIELHGVGHVYSRGTPWANRALTGVDLTIREGEAIVVVGHNGSGKSTLAWILAGLLAPSEGTALLDDRPIVRTGRSRRPVVPALTPAAPAADRARRGPGVEWRRRRARPARRSSPSVSTRSSSATAGSTS